MKKNEDITLDDMKSEADIECSGFIDEQVNNMLTIVKQYESENDYWFTKYYQIPSFCFFTLGAMAACEDDNIWIKPWEEIPEHVKTGTIKLLESTINKDVWNLFKDKKDLAFRLFGYGTHQANLDRDYDLDEEENLI